MRVEIRNCRNLREFYFDPSTQPPDKCYCHGMQNYEIFNYRTGATICHVRTLIIVRLLTLPRWRKHWDYAVAS